MRILDNPTATTQVLIASVVCIWLAAAALAQLVPSQLVVQPPLAEGANDIHSVVGTFALIAAATGALETFLVPP